MPTVSLDSFQLVVALYLFYIAIKGKGQMYRFGQMSSEQQQRIRKPLRLIYAGAGLIALLDTGVCMLQGYMFTLTNTGGANQVTQNFSLDAFPFITYELLSAISFAMTMLVVLTLAGVAVWMYRLSKDAQKRTPRQ